MAVIISIGVRAQRLSDLCCGTSPEHAGQSHTGMTGRLLRGQPPGGEDKFGSLSQEDDAKIQHVAGDGR